MSVSLPSLLAKRVKLRGELIAMQKRAEEADPEAGTMDADTQAIFDRIKGALAELETAISNRAAVDAFERAETGRSVDGTDGQFEKACRAFRANIAIAGAASLRCDDGAEREVSQELARRSGRRVEGVLIPFTAFHRPIERRVLTPGGSGVGIIGTYLDDNQFIDILRANIVCAKLGARYLTGLTQDTDFPRLSASATAQWVADGSGITTDTTEAFNKLSIRPNTVGAIVEFTRQMLLTSTPAVQDAVRNDMTAVIARAIDLAALAGAGAPAPTGILSTTSLNIISGGTNGAALTWPALLALVESVELANAPTAALGWVGNPHVRAALMNTLRFSGVAAGTCMENPNEIAGLPFQSTTQIPLNTKGSGTNLSTLIFGAWDEVVIAMFGEGVEVLVNPYGSTQFASGNIQVRVIATADVEVKHIAAFAAMNDVIAA